MIRVYRYALRPPKIGADLVRAQLDAARDYANDLVAIERGRRAAVRALHDTPEVRAAIELLRASTRSTRADALRALSRAREDAESLARCEGGHWALPPDWIRKGSFSPLYEIERLAILEGRLVRDARALTTCFWGSYLDIEAAAQQARKAPLYDEADGLTPSDPHFRRRRQDGLREGQVGIQVQSTKPMVGSLLLIGKDARVRIVESGGHHVLWIRVGSDGRAPVWAAWDMYSMHRRKRAIPDAASIKWVRASCRVEADREHWSCEVTLGLPHKDPRSLDRSLVGALAVELGWWSQDDGSMVVATWLDSEGRSGRELLSARNVEAVRHPDGIQAVRDIGRDDIRERLARSLREAGDLPRWAIEACNTMHLWKSKDRFHTIWQQWVESGWTGCPDGRALLEAWHHRDRHLHQYEDCEREQSLRRRREQYRLLAARWSRQYRTVLLPDRDLSREARFGEDADCQFTASPQQLRGALRNAFGADAQDVLWRGPHGVEESENEDAPTWLESAIEQWRDGKFVERARKSRKSTDHLQKGGAWAARKARKASGKSGRNGPARNPFNKAAE